MLLKSSKIRELLEADIDDINQSLIITPILDWEKQISEGSASIDIRLGSWFLTASKSRLPSLDPLETDYLVKTLSMVEETYVGIGDCYILHPRQFVLGITLEWIHLPVDIGAYVLGRSSWGREGLIIATATGVQPGFSGVLILELSNIGEIPIKLYPGATIAQLFLHTVEKIEENKARDDSVFFGQTKPIRAVPINEKDIAIISKFRDNLEDLKFSK